LVLSERVTTDFAAARLSLQRALSDRRWADVVRDAEYLRGLVSHLDEPGVSSSLRRIADLARQRLRDDP